jgi:hypothetical protein
MRRISDEEFPGWAQRFREQARQQADALVPRPGCPIYGLASPALRPVSIVESSLSTPIGGTHRDRMLWEHVTLCYGDTMAGPYVKVTTTATDGLAISSSSSGGDSAAERTEARLRSALDTGRVRADPSEGRWAVGPVEVTRERMSAGDALVARQDGRWAARLPGDGSESVLVAVLGLGVEVTDVRLEKLPDLRDIIAAHYEELTARVERARRQPRRPPPPPPPGFVPAEGTAALRAIAEHTLVNAAERRAAFLDEAARRRAELLDEAAGRQAPGRDRRPHRPAPGWAEMYGALWRQAASEYQRLSGADLNAANDSVTTAVNHLLHLQENVPWFSADARLREAAIDETVCHAMLGIPVLSEPAQLAWNRYWYAKMGQAPDFAFAAGDPLGTSWETGWRAAWEAWARDA